MDYVFDMINMCDHEPMITHMQIPPLHTQVWYDTSAFL